MPFLASTFVSGQTRAEARELTVAAASDLQYALPAVIQAFSAQSGVPVRVTYGSSGNLSAQIANGAPFDILLSADASYPRALIEQGNADPASLRLYARGVLVLWLVPPRSEARDLKVLLLPSIQHVAIANPKHAPYGRAAEAALRSSGTYDQVAPKLVLGQNISQTAQFVESGNAQAGLIAKSLLQGGDIGKKGTVLEIPLDSYPPLDQAAVVTRRGRANPAAREFVEFLRSGEAQAIFKRFGFLPPAEAK